MRTLANRYFFAVLAVCTLGACSGPREHFSVLADASGETGKMVMTPHKGGAITLDKTTATVSVSRGEAKPTAMSQEALQKQYGAALDAQPKAPVRFTLYFVEGGDALTPESVNDMARVWTEIKQRPAPDVVVVGHTDRVGSIEDNDRLALRRAEKIRTQLLASDLPADSVSASGRGEREPMVPTPDETPEPRNRRVEIIVR